MSKETVYFPSFEACREYALKMEPKEDHFAVFFQKITMADGSEQWSYFVSMLMGYDD